MSASDFLRRHGWQMRANHWEHPKFPDVLHSQGTAVKLTLPEARYVCGCGHVFHGPFMCCGGAAFKLPEGMHLVSDADVRVLDHCAELKISTDAIGPVSLNGQPQICSSTQGVAAAEFARREGK